MKNWIIYLSPLQNPIVFFYLFYLLLPMPFYKDFQFSKGILKQAKGTLATPTNARSGLHKCVVTRLFKILALVFLSNK